MKTTIWSLRGKLVLSLPVIIFGLISLACESEASVTRVVQGTTPSPQPTEIQKETQPAITNEPTPTVVSEVTETPTPSPVGTATINTDRCNLRSGPGKNYEVVGNAKRGDTFPIFGKDATGDWLSIEETNTKWIAASLVKTDIDIASIPVLEIEPAHAAIAPGETQEHPKETPSLTIEASDINPTLTPVVSNGQIDVFNIAVHKSSDGGIVVYGEVLNRGDKPIKRAEVTLSLYDSDNNLLDTDSGYAYLPWEHNLWNTGILYPTERASFVIIFDDPGAWVLYKADLEYEDAREREYSEHYPDLQIINDIGRPIDDILFNYQVSGEIKNTGNSLSGPVWVVVTLYDKNGQVVGVGEVVTDVERLGPGEIEPFKIQEYARGPVASYRILFRAYRH
jgi:hypothetical protein